MSRLLLLAGLLFAASGSAQTMIKITVPNGGVCTYTTGPVSSTSGGILQATATAQTGSGCSTGGSGGTPSADFTFTTNGLMAAFTDTSTDSGGTIGTHLWDFGDGGTSNATNPSHTYASANTYSVTETVTDSINGAPSSKTKSVTVSAGGTSDSCPVIASSTPSKGSNFSRWTGVRTVFYYGMGANTGNQQVDVTSHDSVWFGAWPGDSGRSLVFTLPLVNYISMKFTVPSNYFTSNNPSVYGAYAIQESQRAALMAMTISTSCGDFSDPIANPSSSTVVPGCYVNNGGIYKGVSWHPSGQCALTNGETYYLNIINADISQVMPNGGGSAASTATKPVNGCTSSSCTDPIQLGGNFGSN